MKTIEETIERIYQIIEVEELKEPSRITYKVCRRWFFYDWLRSRKFKFQQIGKMFNTHHATIMYGIAQANTFTQIKDKKYLAFTHDLMIEFGDVHVDLTKFDLINDVLEAKTTYDLIKIQKRIELNLYKRDDTKIIVTDEESTPVTK